MLLRKLFYKDSIQTKAAAKEKFVPSTRVHSEDLTASQFASMIGIKNQLAGDTEGYQIWDSSFWKHNHQRNSLPIPIPTKSNSSSIQKGRFKIVWGEEEKSKENIRASVNNCIEWKRKRASTAF